MLDIYLSDDWDHWEGTILIILNEIKWKKKIKYTCFNVQHIFNSRAPDEISICSTNDAE